MARPGQTGRSQGRPVKRPDAQQARIDHSVQHGQTQKRATSGIALFHSPPMRIFLPGLTAPKPLPLLQKPPQRPLSSAAGTQNLTVPRHRLSLQEKPSVATAFVSVAILKLRSAHRFAQAFTSPPPRQSYQVLPMPRRQPARIRHGRPAPRIEPQHARLCAFLLNDA